MLFIFCDMLEPGGALGDHFWTPGGDFGAPDDDFGAFGYHEAALRGHLGPSGLD